jgi:hypothetical protein
MMGIPQLTAQQIAQLSGFVSRYITAKRDKFLGQCVPLTQEQRTAMDGFFSPHLLWAMDARTVICDAINRRSVQVAA